MKTEKSSHHTDHEGAEESGQPGQPASRQVIKPDWVELDKEEKGGKPDHTADVPGDADEQDKT